MAVYLDFEEPIKVLEDQLIENTKLQEEKSVDTSKIVKEIEKKIKQTRKEIYNNLSAWQKVQVSRHPERPYTLSYIEAITDGEFLELHGDRTVKDDKAMVGGFGSIDGQSVMFIGQQKGINTKMRQYRNFGMANPEGYRKALRLMKMAEKFGKPVVSLIDTPGAFPGLEAEERGQGEAIARNLIEMTKLKVPIICIIIGEGASGGALGIGIGDKVLMMENSWYSVISPENCSTILWRSWEFKEKAANALKLTSDDMMKNKLIDGVIKEPLGGVHTFPNACYKNVKKAIKESIAQCKSLTSKKLVKIRMDKFSEMGVFNE